MKEGQKQFADYRKAKSGIFDSCNSSKIGKINIMFQAVVDFPVSRESQHCCNEFDHQVLLNGAVFCNLISVV